MPFSCASLWTMFWLDDAWINTVFEHLQKQMLSQAQGSCWCPLTILKVKMNDLLWLVWTSLKLFVVFNMYKLYDEHANKPNRVPTLSLCLYLSFCNLAQDDHPLGSKIHSHTAAHHVAHVLNTRAPRPSQWIEGKSPTQLTSGEQDIRHGVFESP